MILFNNDSDNIIGGKKRKKIKSRGSTVLTFLISCCLFLGLSYFNVVLSRCWCHLTESIPRWLRSGWQTEAVSAAWRVLFSAIFWSISSNTIFMLALASVGGKKQMTRTDEFCFAAQIGSWRANLRIAKQTERMSAERVDNHFNHMNIDTRLASHNPAPTRAVNDSCSCKYQCFEDPFPLGNTK